MIVADQGLDNQSYFEDRPTIRVTWDEDSSCDDITEESLAWDGSAFQPASYDNIVCNSHEQRYSANAYQLDSHHSNDAGDATSWIYVAGTNGSHSHDETDLEYGTEYGYTVRAFNNAGEGGSTSGSDVSSDCEINITDIVLLVNFILEFETPTEQQQILSDYNSDGEVNITDVVLMVIYILEQ